MQIQNPDVASALRDITKLTLSEVGDVSVGSNVQSVIDVTPRANSVINISRDRTSAGTIYAVGANEDFYMYGVFLNYEKIAADTGTVAVITAFVGGISRTIIRSVSVTLTARQDRIYIPFTLPIRVDKGTNIALALTGTFTTIAAGIHGSSNQ